jgi:hypothetical protein
MDSSFPNESIPYNTTFLLPYLAQCFKCRCFNENMSILSSQKFSFSKQAKLTYLKPIPLFTRNHQRIKMKKNGRDDLIF